MSRPSQDDLLTKTLDGAAALLLDVDDTIVDTEAAMVDAGTVAAAALWPGRAAEHASMARRYYDDPEKWFPRYAAGELTFEAMRAGRLSEVARAHDLEVADGAHALYERAYAPAFGSAQRLFPDVPALLEAADRAGLPVALLTNSAQAPTVQKLAAVGLGERFEVVVTTDTLGFGKPDPRVYLEASKRLGRSPAQTVCVGDNLEWDVLGAQRAGLRAIWLDRVGAAALTGRRAVTTIASLDELTEALGCRFGRAHPDR